MVYSYQDSGNAKPCIATTLLDGLDKSSNKEEYEDMVINVTAMAYQGWLSVLFSFSSINTDLVL